MGRDVEGMALVAGEAACALAADEGLHSFEDVRRHHAMGAGLGVEVDEDALARHARSN